MAKVQNQKKRKRRYAAPIGGAFLILAVIGVVTVVIASIRLTTTFLDNTNEKKRFEQIIQPVVMFNPSPFESPADVEMTNLLRYSMYAALRGDKRSSYGLDEANELVVPAADLDAAAATLFGPEIKLEHQSFREDNENSYIYEEEEGVYLVPESMRLYVYSPRVDEITKDGDFLRLLVGYIPPATAMTDTAAPEKYMIYVMKQAGDNYQLAKVQDPPPELAKTLDGAQNAQQVSG